MKNIFGAKKDKKSMEPVIDGIIFRTNRVYDYQEKELDNDYEFINEQEHNVSLPTFLGIIKFISIFIIIVVFLILIRVLIDGSFKMVYDDAPYIFYILGFCISLSIILYLYEKTRYRKVVKSEEFREGIQDFEKHIEESMETLGIPKEAKSIDVFCFTYKESKKGKVKINTNSYFKYINSSSFVYVKQDCLCFADAYEVISIPLTSLVEIRKINKKALVVGWNKDENFNKGRYKKYKIRANQYGTLYIKPYYSIRIDDRLGQYEVLVPCYDIDEIVKLTNLNIIDES